VERRTTLRIFDVRILDLVLKKLKKLYRWEAHGEVVNPPLALFYCFLATALLNCTVDVGAHLHHILDDAYEVLLVLLQLPEGLHLLIDVPLDLLTASASLELLLSNSFDVLGEVALDVACEVAEEVQKWFVAQPVDTFERLFELGGVVLDETLVHELYLFTT